MDLAPAAPPPPRDRDRFLREMVGELARTLTEVVGAAEAEGLVRTVGLRLGAIIEADYPRESPDGADPTAWIAGLLVDLKRKIRGGFSVESIRGTRIVLVNDACPFAEQAPGRPVLCQMTTTVLGTIAAARAGYADVRIEEAIARGDHRCRVVVELDPEQGSSGSAFYR